MLLVSFLYFKLLLSSTQITPKIETEEGKEMKDVDNRVALHPGIFKPFLGTPGNTESHHLTAIKEEVRGTSVTQQTSEARSDAIGVSNITTTIIILDKFTPTPSITVSQPPLDSRNLQRNSSSSTPTPKLIKPNDNQSTISVPKRKKSRCCTSLFSFGDEHDSKYSISGLLRMKQTKKPSKHEPKNLHNPINREVSKNHMSSLVQLGDDLDTKSTSTPKGLHVTVEPSTPTSKSQIRTENT